MSKYSHPETHTPEQVLHVKRTPTGRLGHKELVRIVGETSVTTCMINMTPNGANWSWLQEPAE